MLLQCPPVTPPTLLVPGCWRVHTERLRPAHGAAAARLLHLHLPLRRERKLAPVRWAQLRTGPMGSLGPDTRCQRSLGCRGESGCAPCPGLPCSPPCSLQLPASNAALGALQAGAQDCCPWPDGGQGGRRARTSRQESGGQPAMHTPLPLRQRQVSQSSCHSAPGWGQRRGVRAVGDLGETLRPRHPSTCTHRVEPAAVLALAVGSRDAASTAVAVQPGVAHAALPRAGPRRRLLVDVLAAALAGRRGLGPVPALPHGAGCRAGAKSGSRMMPSCPPSQACRNPCTGTRPQEPPSPVPTPSSPLGPCPSLPVPTLHWDQKPGPSLPVPTPSLPLRPDPRPPPCHRTRPISPSTQLPLGPGIRPFSPSAQSPTTGTSPPNPGPTHHWDQPPDPSYPVPTPLPLRSDPQAPFTQYPLTPCYWDQTPRLLSSSAHPHPPLRPAPRPFSPSTYLLPATGTAPGPSYPVPTPMPLGSDPPRPFSPSTHPPVTGTRPPEPFLPVSSPQPLGPEPRTPLTQCLPTALGPSLSHRSPAGCRASGACWGPGTRPRRRGAAGAGGAGTAARPSRTSPSRRTTVPTAPTGSPLWGAGGSEYRPW